MDDSPPVKAAFRPASFPPIEPSSSPPDRENPWNVSSAMPEFTPGPKLKDVVRADRNPRPPKRTDTDGSESSSIPKLPKNKPGCRRLATPRSLSSHTVQTPTDCTRAPDCTIARRSVNRRPRNFFAESVEATQPVGKQRLNATGDCWSLSEKGDRHPTSCIIVRQQARHPGASPRFRTDS